MKSTIKVVTLIVMTIILISEIKFLSLHKEALATVHYCIMTLISYPRV